MKGYVIQFLAINSGRCYYSTCKGDFMPVSDISLATVFYYAHAANKAATEIMKCPLGSYLVCYKVIAL